MKNIIGRWLTLFILLVLMSKNSSGHSYTAPLYIATDRELYSAGETVQFEILMLHQPANSNNTVFVELLDCNGSLFSKKMLPVNAGTAWGSIDLPVEKNANFYLLYCYTTSKDSVEANAIKKIALKQDAGKNLTERKAGLSCFFEGGSFIAQAPNTLLLKCHDENGNGISTTGKITSTTYADMIKFETDEQGYAKIIFTPENKVLYSITADTKKWGSIKYELPMAAPGGVNLSAAITDSLISYSAYSFSSNSNELDYKLNILSNGQTVYHADINFQPGLSVIKETLKLKDFPEGFLSLQLSGNNNKLYAQRIIYNSTDTGNLHFIRLIDTVNNRVAETAIPNFVTGYGYINVLLKDTIAGHDYTGINVKVNETLLLKNGPGNALNLNDLLIPYNKPPGDNAETKANENPFLTLSGRAYNNENKALKNRKLNIILLSKNLKKQFLVAKTDGQGNFEIKNLVFYDSVTMYYQLGDQSEDRNNLRLEYKVSPDITASGRELQQLNFTCAAVSANNNSSPVIKYIGNDSLRKDEKTLTELVVKSAKPKTASEEYAAKNVSDQHNQSNFARNEFDFIANPPAADYTPIFQFLRGRMASLIINIAQNGFVKISTNYGAGIGIYLNDMLIDGEDLGTVSTLTVSDLALVRYYSVALKPRESSTKSKYGAFFGKGGDGGDLMIYTKKDFVPADPKIKSFNKATIAGYQLELPVRKTNSTTDYPQSLYWKPDYEPGTDQIIYVTLPADNTKNSAQLIIEGINLSNIPYSFIKNLVFK